MSFLRGYPMDPDITKSRHKNNPASNAAFERGQSSHEAAKQRVYELIAESQGITSKEIAERLGWSLHTFSGRISQLKAAGFIRGTGERRYGAEVLVAVRKAEQMSLLGDVA